MILISEFALNYLRKAQPEVVVDHRDHPQILRGYQPREDLQNRPDISVLLQLHCHILHDFLRVKNGIRMDRPVGIKQVDELHIDSFQVAVSLIRIVRHVQYLQQ